MPLSIVGEAYACDEDAGLLRDNRELVRRAAQLLLRHLEGEDMRQEVVLPTEFVPRASCAPPAQRP